MIRKRRSALGSAGLTLPELLATVGIAAIMMAFALPSIRGMMAGYRLRGAAQEVYGALQSARMEAVKENNRFVFEVLDQTTYSVLDDDNNNGVPDDGEVLEKHVILKGDTGLTLKQSNTVVFLPNGRALIDGGTGIFTVTSDGAKSSREIWVTGGGAMRVVIP